MRDMFVGWLGLSGRMYLRVTHGCHDTMSSSIESTLDNPFLRTGDPDDGASVFGANGVGELHGY